MGSGAPFAAWLGSFESPDQRASDRGASRAWGGRRRRRGARPRRPELGVLGFGAGMHNRGVEKGYGLLGVWQTR